MLIRLLRLKQERGNLVNKLGQILLLILNTKYLVKGTESREKSALSSWEVVFLPKQQTEKQLTFLSAGKMLLIVLKCSIIGPLDRIQILYAAYLIRLN